MVHLKASLMIPKSQLRNLSIHEYHAQNLLKEAGIRVARGELAEKPQDAERIASSLGTRCVLKSQVLSGGRGKGAFESGLKGGIQFPDSPSDARRISSQMLGQRLYTKQGPGNGLLVNKLYVTERINYKAEYYLALTIDRETFAPVLMVSKQGGMDVEAMAKRPDALLKVQINYSKGITDDNVSRVSNLLALDCNQRKELEGLLGKLWKLFCEKDMTLLEVNPLVLTKDNGLLCLDAKFTFDNAASNRQQKVFGSRDLDQKNPQELEAEESGLVYVRLDGNIGNVVNGAGLAMATNDAISYYGGQSANFLDTGGQATSETMVKAFEIILRDDRVKVILVNIYGGIIRCDMIAESIIAAASKLGSIPVPIVVRLQGTNSKEGQKMIAGSGLKLFAESDFGRAAQRAVEIAQEA